MDQSTTERGGTQGPLSSANPPQHNGPNGPHPLTADQLSGPTPKNHRHRRPKQKKEGRGQGHKGGGESGDADPLPNQVHSTRGHAHITTETPPHTDPGRTKNEHTAEGGGGGEGSKRKKKKKKPNQEGKTEKSCDSDKDKTNTPMKNNKHQAERMERESRMRNRGKNRRVFEDYRNLKEVSDGLKRGTLIQGALRINPKNYHEAFLPSPDGAADIYLDGVVARNRALNGDLVVVELLPSDQWKVWNDDGEEQRGKEKPKLSESSNPDVTVEAEFSEEEEEEEELRKKMEAVTVKSAGPVLAERGEHANKPSNSNRNVQRTGKVVYIVEQKHSRAASGFLKFLPEKPFALFSPSDHRVPRVNVPLSDCPADFPSRPADYTHTLYICRITHWPSHTTFPEGRLLRSLGQAGLIEPETEAMLMEYDVDYSEFPQDVLDCLPQSRPWTIPPEEIRRRRDLRPECIFTIDPATARDLDDALSCKQLPDGNLEVGVHIADVSYFLEEGNSLDLIARRRATSVYLVQKVIPMLPRLLCEDLCSLNPQTDRLTFSVIWTLSPEGKILSEWFGRSLIRSCVKLSYDHAQSLIDFPDKVFSADEIPPVSPEHSLHSVHQSVLNLHAIAKHLRTQRFRGGALRLDQMKLAFTLDSDSGLPQGCYIYNYRDSNKLVEEFMLLANMAVAHQIYRWNPELALLRRHAEPQSRLIEALQELCDHIGLNLDLSSAGALHRTLGAAFGDDEYSEARRSVLTHLCARPMQMAVYFCSGVLKEEKLFHHYALNVPLYTHFTSPIRRYADVIVHRLLATSLKCGGRFGLGQEEVQKQATICNDRKTASKRVQEMSTELFFSVFVRESGPLDSEAMVMGILDKSFDVLVLRYGVQKRIYCSAVEGLKSFNFCKIGKRPEMTLIWTKDQSAERQQVISLFSVVEVQLTAAEGPLRYTALLRKPQ